MNEPGWGAPEMAAALDSAGGCVWVLGTDGRCAFINQAACEMLGYTREECLGSDLHRKVHGRRLDGTDYPAEECPVRSAIRGGETAHVRDEVVWRRDGTPVAVEYFVRPVRLGGGTIGSVVTAFDVSEARRAEMALRRSEERFRTAFENALVGMVIIDLEGRYLQVNGRMCRLTGYAASELLGRDFAGLTHPDDREESLELGRALLAGEIAEGVITKRYLHRDGRILWVRCNVVLVRDERGEPLHFLSLTEDITERRRTEQTLEESERRFCLIAQTIDDVFWMAHIEDGRVLYVSPAYDRIWGRASQDLYDNRMSFLDGVHPEDVERVRSDLACMQRGEPYAHEYRLRRPDGAVRWILDRGFPVRDESGAAKIYIGVAQDITERKRLERAAREHAEELVRSNAELERFAYIASHDLQEPLRMVSSYTHLLAKRYAGQLDERADRYLRYAADGARRMQMLIQDLLDYSRVNKQEHDLRPSDCALIFESALGNLEASIRQTGAVITYGPLPTVLADSCHLSQLFQNLLGNALKFRAGDPPRVHVSAEPAGDDWVFSVRDNGIGIDPRYADKCFEIFQRLHSRTEYPGAGIGLAICKRVVERHGGRIWVESQPGIGSDFRFTLPRRMEGGSCEASQPAG